MSYKKLLFLLLILIQSSKLFSQHLIKENDYTVYYFPNKIQIEFNKPLANPINAIDVFSKKEINITSLAQNKFEINSFTPAEIIKLEFQLADEKNASKTIAYLATPSASTGTINVYFNHPVNVSYAQIQSAINLSNTLDDKLISYINSCQSTLDIAIYSSYSPSSTTGIAGAINAAYARGVQVRVIYDGTASNFISLLNTNIPTLPSPTTLAYTIMHNKFVVFDANSIDATKPCVWTGSTNWTTSQIDGPDKNSAIIIQDQALALGYKIEFEEMWGGSGATPNLTNSKFGQYKTDNTPHHYIIGGKTVDSYFSPSDGTTSKIVAAINTANSDIEAAVMDITRSDCSTAIINRFNAGVINSNVIVDSQNPSGNQITTLQTALTSARAIVYNTSGIMHHKFVVIDNYNASSDPQVVLGSHNWSTGAETKNDENTLIVHELNITNQYYQAFAYLFQLAGGTLVNNTFEDTKISVYPNPSKDIFTITANNLNNAKITIYDVLGNSIYSNTDSILSVETIDLSYQSEGIYFLIVESENKTFHYKLIKQ